ncbi:MAG: glycosyltransferase family 2 protein, partial [Candidatus Poseidonia sp.]|nr:glycosyltransferase family 2 protein [Poseidonia sp.]
MSKSHEDIHPSTTMQHLVVLLPVLNEALGLDWVLKRLPNDALKSMGFSVSVLVMDGHSTDQTSAVAAEHGVHFLEQQGHGKGSAIRHGFREALNMGANVVVMLDADGTYAPAEMTKLIARLDRYDVVIGDRLSGEIAPTAMTRMNFVGNHLLTWFATAIYGVPTKDVCSGYWAFSQRS